MRVCVCVCESLTVCEGKILLSRFAGNYSRVHLSPTHTHTVKVVRVKPNTAKTAADTHHHMKPNTVENIAIFLSAAARVGA